MSFVLGVHRIRPSSAADPVDLNLTPIMNLFLVIIPFLASMAVFVHTSVIQVTLPRDAAGLSSGAPRREDLKLTVAISTEGFKVALGDSLYADLPAPGGAHDYAGLAGKLSALRPFLSKPDDLLVAVHDGIVFDKVVQVMDAGRTAGFSRIGLSAGARKEPPR